jgi:hypothetical protein
MGRTNLHREEDEVIQLLSPRRFECVQALRRIVYDSEDCAEGIKALS